jgi:hypothetical protein
MTDECIFIEPLPRFLITKQVFTFEIVEAFGKSSAHDFVLSDILDNALRDYGKRNNVCVGYTRLEIIKDKEV